MDDVSGGADAGRTAWGRSVAALLTLGALLRGLLIFFPRAADDDTDAYAELGHNLLHHGTYGFMDDGVVSPALFRLPGYPLVLGLLGEKTWLVLCFQTVIDLLGCVLLALVVRRHRGERAGLVMLGLGATCWFTATYAALAMTESLSIFAVALAIYGVDRLLARPDAFHGLSLKMIALPAVAAALAMLLRPDGVLVTISIGFALVWYGYRQVGLWRAASTALLFCALASLPLVPWTIRNAITFHVFQPLAPRHVNDPGERVNVGFYRWLRTWSVDYETTAQVFWKVSTGRIDPAEIASRACYDAAECVQTAALIARYNQKNDLDQPLDDAFGELAARLIHERPVRYYLLAPAARVADMWLRPRTDGTHIPASWWKWREHPWGSAAAVGLLLLNLAYVLGALGGAVSGRLPVGVMMGSYLGLRYVLLGGMENPEQRYTVECYPIVLLYAGLFLGRFWSGKTDVTKI
jgi:hypothetical protein